MPDKPLSQDSGLHIVPTEVGVAWIKGVRCVVMGFVDRAGKKYVAAAAEPEHVDWMIDALKQSRDIIWPQTPPMEGKKL